MSGRLTGCLELSIRSGSDEDEPGACNGTSDRPRKQYRILCTLSTNNDTGAHAHNRGQVIMLCPLGWTSSTAESYV